MGSGIYYLPALNLGCEDCGHFWHSQRRFVSWRPELSADRPRYCPKCRSHKVTPATMEWKPVK